MFGPITLVWFLTYVTNVSVIVQCLLAMGFAIFSDPDALIL